MRIARFVAVLLAAALVGQVALAQEKVQSKITVLVPEKGHGETVLTISGTATEQKGTERKFTTPPLDKGSSYTYTFQALIEPNNYTKITRTKAVTFKAGDDVKVDLTHKDEKTDAIVVRYVPTPDDIVDKMCELAKVGKNDVVHDYGCGDGVMLIRPIQKFGAKRGVGIEYDPKIIEMHTMPNIKKAKLEDKITIKQGDILKLTPKDCEDATVVLLYIGDDLGERLGPVLQKSLKPGARVVSHRFTLGDWEPTRVETVMGQDGEEYTLLLWIIGEKAKKK